VTAVPAPQPDRSAREWWANQSTVTRVLVTLGALVVGINLAAYALRLVVGRDPGGPTSSSFATAGDGLAAFSRLAEREGHPVVRLTVPLDQAVLAPEATIVVARPRHFSESEGARLSSLARAGTRVVLLGDVEQVGPLAEGLAWTSGGPRRSTVQAPVELVSGIEELEGAGNARWQLAARWLPVAGDRWNGEARTVLATVRAGSGEVIALADATVLDNEHLARADNAALGLRALGPPDRPVFFAEAAHGFGAGRGWSAAPGSWRWAAALGAFSIMVLFWARGRRFGPADRVTRSLAPARSAFAESLALTLDKADQPAVATEALARRARRRAAAVPSLPPEVASRLGLLDRAPTTRGEALELGRLAAELEERTTASRPEPTPPATPTPETHHPPFPTHQEIDR